MDLDSALLRAFVATAEERHFGRAADRLYVTQQALSKRIQRLEDLLGVRLLDRTRQHVDLTAAGEVLLEHARHAVDSVDAAVAAVHARQRPLVVDVLDEHLAPLRLVHRAMEQDPGLRLDVTMRTTTSALATLHGGGADVVFGRAGALGTDWPGDVYRRAVLLEHVALLAGRDHPLAGRDRVTLEDLRTERLWFPLKGSPDEWVQYLRELSARFGLDIDYSGSTMGFPMFLEQAATRATFFGLGMAPPPDERVRVIPIVDPAPVFPWWAMWTRRVPLPLVVRLTAGLVSDLTGHLSEAMDPRRCWMPGLDLAYLAADLAR